MTVKERNQLVREFNDAVINGWKTPPERFLDLLQALEKTDFKKSVNARFIMCSSLTCFIEYNEYVKKSTYYEAMLKTAAKLLALHARQVHQQLMLFDWFFSRNPIYEELFRTQKWALPLAPVDGYSNAINGAILMAFKLGYDDWLNNFVLTSYFANYVLALREALGDRDKEIRDRATNFCHSLQKKHKKLIFNLLARDVPDEEYSLDWLVTYKYYSKSYTYSKVIVSLLTGEYYAQVKNENQPVISALVKLVSGNKLTSRGLPDKAKDVLRHLKTAAGRDYFCLELTNLILHNGNYNELQAIALEAGYEPTDLTDKTLFFFLTRQFDKYDALDFDRRLMRNMHENADNNLRRQIGQIVRTSGRTDYLEILAKGQHQVSDKLAINEQKTTIQVLRSNGRWDAIWQKVFELPFWSSVRALGVLLKADWQPASDYERELLTTLTNLLRAGLPHNQPFNSVIPAGVLREKTKIGGRVNAIAFAPDSTRLAIATGNRKTFIWNMSRGVVEQTLTGFGAAVGQVCYMPDGTLICLERSSRANYEPGIWTWDEREKRRLGNAPCSVISVRPLNGSEILILSSSEIPQVWNLITRQIVPEQADSSASALPPQIVLGGNWRIDDFNGGIVTFRHTTKENLTGKLLIPGKELVTTETSPDGNFMVAITDENCLQIWDLRALELLELLDLPFGAADTRYMAAVLLMKDAPDIAQPVRNAFLYIETILRHRFRHAIEVDFAPPIQPADFDVELESD
jgi:hypothetical protein